jgi:hypothetical protein
MWLAAECTVQYVYDDYALYNTGIYVYDDYWTYYIVVII